MMATSISAEPAECGDALRLFEDRCTNARLTELGTRASALGHELRQPLFTIAMATENLQLMLEADDLPKERMLLSVERIAEQVQRAQNLIVRVLDEASGARREGQMCNPGEAISNALRFLDDLFAHAGVAIRRYPIEPSALVALDRIQLEQIFVNVLRNAVESIQERRQQGWDGDGQIGIGFILDNDGLRCLICDNGVGLAPGVSQTVFRPFVTTKLSGGTGLGLYICERILARVGGTIRLLPRKSQGARVEVVLPAVLVDERSDDAGSLRTIPQV